MGEHDELKKKVVGGMPLGNHPYLEIGKIISENDLTVMNELEECIFSSESYFNNHVKQYNDRGIDNFNKPNMIRWIGLVDILEKNNYVCERDYKDELDDFMYFLQNLKGSKTMGLSIDEAWFVNGEDINGWCLELDENWKQYGMCVAAMDIDSDSFVLFPCKLNDLDKLSQFAIKGGWKISYAKYM